MLQVCNLTGYGEWITRLSVSTPEGFGVQFDDQHKFRAVTVNGQPIWENKFCYTQLGLVYTPDNQNPNVEKINELTNAIKHEVLSHLQEVKASPSVHLRQMEQFAHFKDGIAFALSNGTKTDCYDYILRNCLKEQDPDYQEMLRLQKKLKERYGS